ncbi:hypothetical protein ACIA8O_17135 [Kitasatospora sp. NPDC051853]|uniref:hypothetical protein n=1 Tax=Kitasatospora sp. NPDC051853 TaxID=3364058 RepID=UPI003796B5FE
MTSDVFLDKDKDGWVTIEAAVVNAQASDLILEQKAYRTQEGGPFRRALVHGENDGLTINFSRDYPGGVTIHDARINLRVETQLGAGDPSLPREGRSGDLLAVSLMSIRPGHAHRDEGTTLWLCVGRRSTPDGHVAIWSKIPLGEPVEGSA